MNQATLKGLLALAAMFALFVGSAFLYRRRVTVGAVLQSFGVACFAVVALTHVLEAFAIVPSFGWGQAHSIGHFIDLGSASLGLMLVFAGLAVQFVQRPSRLDLPPTEGGSH